MNKEIRKSLREENNNNNNWIMQKKSRQWKFSFFCLFIFFQLSTANNEINVYILLSLEKTLKVKKKMF